MEKARASERFNFKIISIILGSTISISGLLVVLAWKFDLYNLKTFYLGQTTMKSNLGLSFFLLGIGLVLLNFRNRLAKILLISISAILFLISLVTIYEISFSNYLKFDVILFYKTHLSGGEQGPVTMALNAAISVLLMSVVFFMMTMNSKFSYLKEFCVVFTFSISFLGIIAFTLGFLEFIRISGYENMAVLAMILFIMLCIGLCLYCFKDKAFKLTENQILLAGLIFISSVFIMISLLSNSGYLSLMETEKNRAMNQEVRNKLNVLLGDILNVESGVRGYFIFEDSSYIESITNVRNDLDSVMEDLSTNLQGNVVQLADLKKLGDLVVSRMDNAEKTGQMLYNSDYDDAMALHMFNRGEILSDSIRVLISRMEDHENSKFQSITQSEIRRLLKIRSITYFNLIFELILISLFFIIIKRNVDQRKKRMERIQDLYENAPCGYHSLDRNGLFIRINNTELEWLGYKREELIGLVNFQSLLTKESRQKFDKDFTKFCKDGKLKNCVYEMVRKNESTFFISINSTIIYDENGNFLMSRDTLFDISETKKFEEELAEAKAIAEESNRLKSEFLANMSHEIRTPMNAVLGYTELLDATITNPVQSDYIKSIRSSGRSLLKLINDILDLSKVEAGMLELEYEFVNTHEFFKEFERIFSFKVLEKGLEFNLQIASGLPNNIYIDEARVRQIVFNLIGNAIKFTKKGSITLSVICENLKRIQYTDDDSEELVDILIEVSDTGLGISNEKQSSIFMPFVQERTYKAYGGTGLGLSISNRLIQLMNGTISVKSEIDKGSTFSIRIPDVSFRKTNSSMFADEHIEPKDIVFEQAVLLIVDDVEHNRKFIRDALSSTAIEVIEAANGNEAYEKIKEFRPNLVITDIRMPELDGFGLLNKILEDDECKDIPVLAYSASVLREQKEKILRSEFVGLLIKPVSLSDLYQGLMAYIPYQKIVRHDEQTELVVEELVDPEKLIFSLENNAFQIWETFKETQPIQEVVQFAALLEDLGKKHNSFRLSDYAVEISSACDSFNIERILSLLNSFPDLIEQIKAN